MGAVGTKRGAGSYSSHWALLADTVERARDELRKMHADRAEQDRSFLSDRWFELWEREHGPEAVHETGAHEHARAIHDALSAALEHRQSLGLMWDALEGPDRDLHEVLERTEAFALTSREFGAGGVRIRARSTRADLVDLALRQFRDFTARELALLSIAAGFSPGLGNWRERGLTPAKVIELETKTIRKELESQAKTSPYAQVQKRWKLREGRRGRPKGK
jgi:hypothetical protein